jgi:cytochrome b6-f complex iron-sulfur subunit
MSEAPGPEVEAAEPEAVAAVEVPTPQKLGRPLTLQEKLAAARVKPGAAPAAKPAAKVAKPAPAPAESVPEPDAAEAEAPAPVKAVPPPPQKLGRPLTLQEKLAAARVKPGAAPAAAPAAKAPKPAPAPAPAAAEEEAEESAPTKAVPPPAAPIGRPLTLQEKLAAARGGAKAPAPAAAGGAKPAAAAAKAAAPAAKAATVARTLPPLEKITDPKDLAEALRQAGAKKAKEAAAAKAATAAPAAKPAKEKETRPSSVLPRPSKAAAAATAAAAAAIPRRAWMSMTALIWIGWGAFILGMTQFTAMMGRFMFPNVLAEPPSTIKIGLPSNYEPEDVNERFKAEWGFWVVRSSRYNGQDIIYAIQSVCTHLGCPPNWLASEQKFKCPCHGSGFYISAINFEGPAPRPLERFKISQADDGQLVVDKSQKFQEELGQWSDPDSFVQA